jgi:hypothetical protein
MNTLRNLAWVLATPAILTLAVGSAAQPRTTSPAPPRASAPAPAPSRAPAPAPTPTPAPSRAAAAPRTAPPSPAPVAAPAVAGWSSLDDARESEATVRLVDWIAASGDNGDLPYIVIDKAAAAVLVFDAKGKLLGASPALIGVAPGDDSSPGIGSKDLSRIGPAERTTPAGRFVSRYGRAAGGETVLWIDWSTSVALHEVVTGNRRERRLERLLSPSPADNRITFGCINVPVSFHREKVRPAFARAGGVVYILPDTKPLESVFPGVLVRQAAIQGAAQGRASRP